jgi:5-methylcytosine-specific restriction endonuclease McrA
MRELTKQYREYLASLQWHAKREAALARSGGECQSCGARRDLEVHHKHYETFGHEQPDDLEVLCIPCHDRADDLRRNRNHRRAAMNTYAEKKYGDYCDSVDPELIAHEFDDWLERRSDF